MWKASAFIIAALAAVVAGQAYAEAPEPAPTAQICDRAPGAWDDTAEANAISLYALEWIPFGPSELG
ncbi:MAG TPA: D-alanyl-D-alanine carboxypeptidase, partial [Brevundimonas sp.]|nr:D-alanyl-D-alanine carboxypeptidase [Brevundimonas sp.]